MHNGMHSSYSFRDFLMKSAKFSVGRATFFLGRPNGTQSSGNPLVATVLQRREMKRFVNLSERDLCCCQSDIKQWYVAGQNEVEISGLIMPKASHQELRRAFRKLLASPRCYHTASVFDPMSARIAADLGFEVGILGGSVASLQVLAAPDFALITLSEFAEQATRIGRVAQLPFIADADHGYGNALNVMRTVIELERAGVSALTIEDTLLPAQFGRKSTDLISIAEGVGKVRAALEARVDPELVIIARTNAAAIPTEEVIARAVAYQNAGADGVCMVGVRDFEHLEEIARHLTVPLMLVTYGNPQLHDDVRLAELGVRIAVDGHGAYFAAIKATYDCLREQRRITSSASDLSATELTHTYTQPNDYIVWAREFMDVNE